MLDTVTCGYHKCLITLIARHSLHVYSITKSPSLWMRFGKQVGTTRRSKHLLGRQIDIQRCEKLRPKVTGNAACSTDIHAKLHDVATKLIIWMEKCLHIHINAQKLRTNEQHPQKCAVLWPHQLAAMNELVMDR